MVIVFDLDDTLYEELSFVKSGFKEVAAFLCPILKLPHERVAALLMGEFKVRREQVSDRVLDKEGMKSLKLIRECLSIYRGHKPAIQLYPEALACLRHFQHLPLYVVTDGNKLVQKSKVEALGLNHFIKKCLYTYAHGIRNSKPSPYCFEKICKMERCTPSSVVYVADNPRKDFIGLKPLGFHTIRVLTGPYRNENPVEEYEAEVKIPHLGLLTHELLQTLEVRSR